MPKPWTERRAAAYHRAVARQARRRLREIGIDTLGPRRSELRLSDMLEAASGAEAVKAAEAIIARWATFAKRDPSLQSLREQMSKLTEKVGQNSNAGRPGLTWRGVAEMRRLEETGYASVLGPHVERGRRAVAGLKAKNEERQQARDATRSQIRNMAKGIKMRRPDASRTLIARTIRSKLGPGAPGLSTIRRYLEGAV